MYNLRDKVAIVTGAARRRGIGRAIALRLASEGANLVLMDVCQKRSDLQGALGEELKEVTEEIKAKGRQVVAVEGDVGAREDVERVVGETIRRFGQVDILVNNAGIGGSMVTVVQTSEEDWDRIMRVNAKGVFLCSQAVAKEMIRLGRGGKIVNIASQAGKRGFVFEGAYCASKFAVVGLTQVMAIELARYKINVNTVCPGTVDTEAIDELFLQLSKYSKSKETPEQIRERIIREQVPLRRIEKPEDVANLVVWLASSEADYMIGESINITGGQTMD
jgi:NAD(P)-dependent dehydrogenase (short-subunit alcohol dehydrogenase family)